MTPLLELSQLIPSRPTSNTNAPASRAPGLRFTVSEAPPGTRLGTRSRRIPYLCGLPPHADGFSHPCTHLGPGFRSASGGPDRHPNPPVESALDDPDSSTSIVKPVT